MSVREDASATVIGRPRRRIDAPEKLTAVTRYAGDVALPGMLHARLVLSPHAHARIVRIDSAGASSVRERVSGGGSAEPAHGTVGTGGEVTHEADSDNVANRLHYQRGDVVRGFSEAEAIVERTYRTSTVHQSYLEPQTATAAVDPLGKLTVWSSTQLVFYTRKDLANSLGLPVDRVRVVAMPLGGGFGGKMLVVEPLVAAGALALKRPVQLAFTRSDDFGAGNPANGSRIWLKIGAARDGRLTSIQARVIFDAGAFPEWSPAGLDPQPDGTPWGRIGLRECLERLRSLRMARVESRTVDERGRAIGMGVAVGGWPGGLEPAAALCRLDQDGGLTVVTGSVDMSGTNTTLAAITAEGFGIPFDQVGVINQDSDSAPYSGMSGGSKITYTVGRAVQRAAEDARRQASAIAADLLEVSIEDVEIVDGRARVVGAPERSLSMADLAGTIFDFGGRFQPVHGRGSTANTVNAPGFVAHMVAVDRETGFRQGPRLRGSPGCRASAEPGCHRRSDSRRGGAGRRLGALRTGPIRRDWPAAGGQLHRLPTADRATRPEVEPVLVEVQAPDGPFGAKGVGEPPVVAGAAAIADALADATGVRMTELPITSEQLFRALAASSAP